MKLRQVALAAPTLEPLRTALMTLLGVTQDFADPGVGEFGLVNSVMALGDTFLEIVSPSQPGTAAGRLLERRGSTCGYMLLMQVEDFAAFDKHLDKNQLRRVWQTDRAAVSACHVHPKDIGGAIVSFDEMRPADAWIWGGPDWQSHRAQHVLRVLGCELQSPNPRELAQRWSDVMQTPLTVAGDTLKLAFDDGTFIDFITGEDYEGITAFTLATKDPAVRFAQAEQLELPVNRTNNEILIGQLGLRFA
jgi:hypothetical protein